MYFELNDIVFSPSDLTLYMDSPFASWMEHLALTNPELLPPTDEENELLGILQHKGFQYEKKILDSFINRGLSVF